MSDNYATVYQGLKLFRDAMLPFIVEKLQAIYGDHWLEQGVARCFKAEDVERLRLQFEKRHDSLVVERPGDELAEMLDINWFGNIIESNWKPVFGEVFGDRRVIGWLQEVREVRNAVAHPQTGDLRTADVWRCLDNAERILRAFNNKAADDVADVKKSLYVSREVPVSAEQWRDYCQSLVDDHARWTELFVPPEALKFVPARLIPVERAGLFPSMPHLRDVIHTPQPAPVAVLNYVRQCENPLVILGDPGQGKTAAVEQLTVEYARRWLEGTEELAPVLVKLNKYDPQQGGLENLIAMSFRSRGLQLDTQQVEQLLGDTSPPLLLMFDGLDEVKVADSTNLKQDIESLLMNYPAHKYIITCRKADYGRFALRIEGEERTELCSFDEKGVRRFLIDYYWSYEKDPGKGHLLFEQLKQQELMSLAQTPLHLGLIMGIAEEAGELPSNRGELYQRFVDKTLELERKKGAVSLGEWGRIERFLAHLALVMHEREIVTISQSETRETVGQYWQKLKDADKCSLPRDQVFDGVWNSRLLMRTDTEASFRHPVLQEYFVAKRLAYMLEDAETDAIYRYVGVPRWDEVFVLLAGMMDDASGLLLAITRETVPTLALKCLASARKVDDFTRLFAVKRILDLLFDPEILTQQAERLFPTLLQLPPNKELMAYLTSSLTERILSSETIPQILIALYSHCGGWAVEHDLLAALENPDEENERLRAVDLLVYLGTEKSVEPLVTCLEEENPDLRFPAVLALGRIGNPRAIEALKPCLFDNDSGVRCIAITALGSLCGADVRPPPTDFLFDLASVIATRQESDSAEVEEVKKLLRRALADSSEEVRTEAAIVLGCLGEVQVVNQLAEILMDAEFKYYQKGRVVRALGHIGTEEAVGAIKKFHSDALIGAVPVEVVRDMTYPGGHVFHDIVWFGSPVGFEISAAFALSGDTWHIRNLVDIVGDWKGRLRATTDEEAGDLSEFIQMYRWDRLRWYVDKMEPAIIAMGAKAVVPLLECISEAEESTEPKLVEEEGHRLLEKIGKATKAEELVKLLAEASQISEEVEGAMYLLGKAYFGAKDPLLDALKENEKLIDLFIEAYQKSEWAGVQEAAAEALARFVRAVGKETAMGAKVYQQIVEPSVEDLRIEEGYKRRKAFLTLAYFGKSQAADWLLEGLEDKDDQKRYGSAYFLLRFYADERAVDTAIEGLRKAASPEIRKGIATQLKELDHPKVVTAFGSALQDPEWWVRWIAAEVLHDKGDESVVEALIQVLDDEESLVRHEAIRALGKIGDPRAVGALTDILCYHEDKDTRWWAAMVLEEIGDPAAAEAFARALQDESADVRSRAAGVLSKLGDANVVPSLVKALTDSEPEVQRAAAHAIGKIGELETVTPLLMEISETGGPNVQCWVAITLAWLKDSSAVELCVEALDCSETGVREEAFAALVSAGTELLEANRLLRLCVDAFESGDKSVRELAVQGLGKVATPEAISLLRGILDSEIETPYMRFWAVLSLINIGTPEVVGTIIEALDDPDEFVRYAAVRGLRNVGGATALPALARVAEEDTGAFGDVSLADAAREAIEQIQKGCGE